MKINKMSIAPDGAGTAVLLVETAEDLWEIYNIAREGDYVEGVTYRKVHDDRGEAVRGGRGSEKVKLRLKVRVETIEYDMDVGELRFGGPNVTESEHVKLGAHHTITVDQHKTVGIEKAAWDAQDRERIDRAARPELAADLAVFMVEEGRGVLLLVGGQVTVQKARIEANLPKKTGAASAGFDKALGKFLDACYRAVLRGVDWSVVKCLVLAGPGFTKDQLKRYLEEQAVRDGERGLVEHRSRVVAVHASSSYKPAMREVMADPAVQRQIADTKAAREARALQGFYDMMARDSARAFYGPGHVIAAAEMGAVETLLVSDSVLRARTPGLRRKYLELLETVRASGGEVLVFSAAHVTGEALGKITGVAATLRFPLPELEDLELPAPTAEEYP